jgi:hypothetical protein
VSKDVFNAACHCCIRRTAKALLKELAWFADDGGNNIWPSVTTLAERTGLARRTVQKRLRALEQIGAIDALGSRLGGRGRTTKYRINLRWLEDNTKTAHKGRPSSSWKGCEKDEKGERQTTERVDGSAKKGERDSPEQNEHEYEKKQEMRSLKTGERKAIPYQHQRLQQRISQYGRRMAVPSPLSGRDLESRRQFLRQQIQSFANNRAVPKSQLDEAESGQAKPVQQIRGD